MKFNRVLQIYKALADETRLRLVYILAHGDFHVNELLDILEMGQSRVSRHLKILYNAGLLVSRREGAFIFYGLKRNAAIFIEKTLQTLLQDTHKLIPDEYVVQSYIKEKKLANTKFFNQVAPNWETMKDEYVDTHLCFQKIEKLVDHSKIVADVGAGTGTLLLSLARSDGIYLGVDISPEMIKIAKKKASERPELNLQFCCGEIENLPIKNESCSTVLMTMVLHHLVSPKRAIQEASRVLFPGGTLIIHDLCKHDDISYQEIYNHRWLGFNREDIASWLCKYGFHEYKFLDNLNSSFICCAHL